MRSLLDRIIVLFLAVPFVTCSSAPYMGIRDCRLADCYTLRRGITKEQFVAKHDRHYDEHSENEYRLGEDVWDVWVFTIWEDIRSSDDPATFVEHQEYVAFKNGLLDEWGWGTLPRVLVKQSK